MFADRVAVNGSCTHFVRQVSATPIIVDSIAVADAPCEHLALTDLVFLGEGLYAGGGVGAHGQEPDHWGPLHRLLPHLLHVQDHPLRVLITQRVRDVLSSLKTHVCAGVAPEGNLKEHHVRNSKIVLEPYICIVFDYSLCKSYVKTIALLRIPVQLEPWFYLVPVTWFYQEPSSGPAAICGTHRVNCCSRLEWLPPPEPLYQTTASTASRYAPPTGKTTTSS